MPHQDGGGREDSIPTSISKRKLLKIAGAGSVSALAGCVGGGNGGGSNGSGGNSGSGDTTANWWNVSKAVIGPEMQTAVNNAAKSVEKETGTNVKVNFSSLSALIGAKWRNAFQNGNNPVVFDSNISWAGPYMDTGYVRPISDYKNRLNQTALDNMKWLTKELDYTYRGYKGDIYEIPYGMNVIEPFVGRMDHFKKAGLDPKKDFPPKNYKHLIEVAKTLEKDGPGKSGYTVYGESSDAFDEQIIAWAMAAGGKKGVYLNEDWSKSQFKNDIWQEWGRKYIEIFTKHDLGPPDTPTLSVEAAAARMGTGRISMMSAGALNLPVFKKNAPDLLKDGTIKWAPNWIGDAGYRGMSLPYTVALTRKPEKVGSKKWKKKTEAGIEIINYLLSKKVQKKLYTQMGMFPVRRDVWDEIGIGNRADNFGTTFKTMAEKGGPAYGAHPAVLPLITNIAPPHIQNALQGKISPEKALNNIANDMNKRL